MQKKGTRDSKDKLQKFVEETKQGKFTESPPQDAAVSFIRFMNGDEFYFDTQSRVITGLSSIGTSNG